MATTDRRAALLLLIEAIDKLVGVIAGLERASLKCGIIDTRRNDGTVEVRPIPAEKLKQFNIHDLLVSDRAAKCGLSIPKPEERLSPDEFWGHTGLALDSRRPVRNCHFVEGWLDRMDTLKAGALAELEGAGNGSPDVAATAPRGRPPKLDKVFALDRELAEKAGKVQGRKIVVTAWNRKHSRSPISEQDVSNARLKHRSTRENQ